MKTQPEPDLILVERKVFLNLIAAADMAREYLANRTARGDDWARRTLQGLYDALPPAVASDHGTYTNPQP